MSDTHITLSSDSESDESPMVRAGVSYGQNSRPLIFDQHAHEVIFIFDDCDSERLSGVLQMKELPIGIFL